MKKLKILLVLIFSLFVTENLQDAEASGRTFSVVGKGVSSGTRVLKKVPIHSARARIRPAIKSWTNRRKLLKPITLNSNFIQNSVYLPNSSFLQTLNAGLVAQVMQRSALYHLISQPMRQNTSIVPKTSKTIDLVPLVSPESQNITGLPQKIILQNVTGSNRQNMTGGIFFNSIVNRGNSFSNRFAVQKCYFSTNVRNNGARNFSKKSRRGKSEGRNSPNHGTHIKNVDKRQQNRNSDIETLSNNSQKEKGDTKEALKTFKNNLSDENIREIGDISIKLYKLVNPNSVFSTTECQKIAEIFQNIMSHLSINSGYIALKQKLPSKKFELLLKNYVFPEQILNKDNLLSNNVLIKDVYGNFLELIDGLLDYKSVKYKIDNRKLVVEKNNKQLDKDRLSAIVKILVLFARAWFELQLNTHVNVFVVKTGNNKITVYVSGPVPFTYYGAKKELYNVLKECLTLFPDDKINFEIVELSDLFKIKGLNIQNDQDVTRFWCLMYNLVSKEKFKDFILYLNCYSEDRKLNNIEKLIIKTFAEVISASKDGSYKKKSKSWIKQMNTWINSITEDFGLDEDGNFKDDNDKQKLIKILDVVQGYIDLLTDLSRVGTEGDDNTVSQMISDFSRVKDSIRGFKRGAVSAKEVIRELVSQKTININNNNIELSLKREILELSHTEKIFVLKSHIEEISVLKHSNVDFNKILRKEEAASFINVCDTCLPFMQYRMNNNKKFILYFLSKKKPESENTNDNETQKKEKTNDKKSKTTFKKK